MKNSTTSFVLECNIIKSAIPFYESILILIALLATVENSLILIAICKYTKVRTPSSGVLAVLCSINILIGVFVVPLEYTEVQFNKRWTVNMLTVRWWINIGIYIVLLSTLVLLCFVCFFHALYTNTYKQSTWKLIGGLCVGWSTPFVVIIVCVVHMRSIKLAVWFIPVFYFTCVLTMIFLYLATFYLLRVTQYDSLSRRKYITGLIDATRTFMIITTISILMFLPPSLSILIGLHRGYFKRMCSLSFLSVSVNATLVPNLCILRMPSLYRHTLKILSVEMTAGEFKTKKKVSFKNAAETRF